MQHQSPTSTEQPSTQHVHILLVEDDEGHVELIRRVFERRATHVSLTTAGTLYQAREHLAQSPPDLLITDLLLPDGRGTELLPVDAEGAAFPVVMMTGFGDEREAAEAIKAGAMDYIVKSEATLADMPHLADRALQQWHNIIERRRTTQRLRLLSSAVEQAADGIAIVDLEGNVLLLNDAASQMHGYTSAELLGKHLSVFHTPEQMPAVEASLRQLRETGQFKGEIWHARRDGSVFPSIMHHSMLRDETGKPISMIGTVQDITELKRTQDELARHRDNLEELVRERTADLEKANRRLQREIVERTEAERELRESEDRFRTLFETTPHGIVEVDTAGNISTCNRAYQRILGYDEEDLHGVNVADLIPEGYRDRVIADLKTNAIRQPAPSPYDDLQHITKDGRVIDCGVAWDYKRDRQGDVAGFVAVVTDVTEKKLAEHELQKEQRLLRQLIDLQERERQLVAYEIHDGLAQQLTGALLQFQAFKQVQKPADEDAPEAGIQRTFQSGLKLLGEGLGEARRLISGLRPPILDESGIIAAIDYLAEEHQQRGGPRIEFHHDVHFDRLAPPLETTVFRVVQESLTNACRYSRSDRVRVGLSQQEARLVVEVEDWGVGFEPDEVRQNRFGLQGIQERARLFGGRATIDSTLGEGTRITVELPVLEEIQNLPDSGRP